MLYLDECSPKDLCIKGLDHVLVLQGKIVDLRKRWGFTGRGSQITGDGDAFEIGFILVSFFLSWLTR